MITIIDPRKGDIEDDASSTKRRSLLALAGSLVAEISLPKLVLAWVLLIALPSFLLGIAPLVASAWIGKVSTHASALYSGIGPAVLLSTLAVLAWLGGGPAFRLVENSFWSLNALGVQPAYAICREVLRHVLEELLPGDVPMAKRNMVRRAGAAMSGLLIGAVAFALAATAWPASRWVGSIADLASPHLLVPIALANAVVIMGTYFAFAALAWGVADAAMASTGGFILLCDTLRESPNLARGPPLRHPCRRRTLWLSGGERTIRAAGQPAARASTGQIGRDPCAAPARPYSDHRRRH